MTAVLASFHIACSGSSSSSTDGTSSSGDGGSGTDGASSTTTSCTSANNALEVLFSPMYSAYDGTHTFQIPAVVNGISASAVTWSVSDQSIAKFATDSTTGGIMITALNAGTVTVTATAGGLCGQSVLTISSATTDDWNAGSSRYNDGIVLRPPMPDGGGDAGTPQEAACTNCHGPTANGAFTDVAHTPEQTGGFSDSDLINIFTKGVVPDGGYFDTSIVPYARWQQFHQWDMTDTEAKGVVVYLRSLTPAPQEGSGNFGGHFDGGPGGPGGPPGSQDSGSDAQ